MRTWWDRDVIDAGKLPLMLCLVAFIVTFVITRGITRSIRSGRGPFRDRVTSGGVHVHHSTPGIASLIVGAMLAVDSDGPPWNLVAAVLVGVGTSLILDEFALLLHLTDVYWTEEGRLSVDLVMLATACLSLALIGFSPIGVDDVGSTELAVRLGGTVVIAVHAVVVMVCVLKGKLRMALFGIFVPTLALIAAVRLARPGSYWFRRRYSPARRLRAQAQTQRFDNRWQPRLNVLIDVVGGRANPAGRPKTR